MKPRTRAAISIAALALFVLLCIGVGVSRDVTPPVPGKRGNDPYAVTVNQLVTHAGVVEGEVVVIIDTVDNVAFNHTTDTLSFSITDRVHDIQVWFAFRNQTSQGGVVNGSDLCVKAESRLQAEGLLIVVDYKVLEPGLVLGASIAGAALLVVAVLACFRIDWHHLALVAKEHARRDRGGGR